MRNKYVILYFSLIWLILIYLFLKRRPPSVYLYNLIYFIQYISGVTVKFFLCKCYVILTVHRR